MLSSALRSSLNAVLMMSCVVYAGSALKSAWRMAMKRIVVPMPRYTYVLLMTFSKYKIFLLRLIHSKTSQTQAQISHNCCFYISLSLILLMIHFPFLLLFLTLKYTLHNVTPYSLSLLNLNVRIHLVHTYIAAVSNHMYSTSKFSSNGTITCLMMLWKINLLGSSTTMCTLILSCIRSNSITLFTSGTFHQKKWTQEAYDQSGWFSKEAENALAWTNCIYKGGKQVLCLCGRNSSTASFQYARKCCLQHKPTKAAST